LNAIPDAPPPLARTPLHAWPASHGARVVEIYSVGPILENAGLNITVLSYHDRLGVGTRACDDATPYVRILAEDLDGIERSRESRGGQPPTFKRQSLGVDRAAEGPRPGARHPQVGYAHPQPAAPAPRVRAFPPDARPLFL